jgi:hypothetical protein
MLANPPLDSTGFASGRPTSSACKCDVVPPQPCSTRRIGFRIYAVTAVKTFGIFHRRAAWRAGRHVCDLALAANGLAAASRPRRHRGALRLRGRADPPARGSLRPSLRRVRGVFSDRSAPLGLGRGREAARPLRLDRCSDRAVRSRRRPLRPSYLRVALAGALLAPRVAVRATARVGPAVDGPEAARDPARPTALSRASSIEPELVSCAHGHRRGPRHRRNSLVPRESKRWRDLYRGRAAVEREFGRLKNEYGLTPLRVGGRERVALHADLTMLARLTLALARARAVPLAA